MSPFAMAAKYFKRAVHCFNLKSIIITQEVAALPCEIPETSPVFDITHSLL